MVDMIITHILELGGFQVTLIETIQWTHWTHQKEKNIQQDHRVVTEVCGFVGCGSN